MTSKTDTIWWRWLVVVVIGVMLFGIGMVLAPGLIRQFFSVLLYASPSHTASFGADAVAYVSLVHAVLGAVMFGWGVALLLALLGPFRQGMRVGWQIVAVSVAAWFVPDSLYSLWSGFWQNALMNLGFLILFAIPLAATYRSFHEPGSGG